MAVPFFGKTFLTLQSPLLLDVTVVAMCASGRNWWHPQSFNLVSVLGVTGKRASDECASVQHEYIIPYYVVHVPGKTLGHWPSLPYYFG